MIYRAVLGLLLCASLGFAQSGLPDAEKADLQKGIQEAGSSPVEFIRALERHLKKYPKTTERESLERAIAKSALEAKDNTRVLEYGQRVLDRDADNPQLLDRVARLLLVHEDRQDAEKALKYSKKLEEIFLDLQKDGLKSNQNRAQLNEELQRGLARAITFQARASGNLGKIDEAVALATKSYERFPSADSAREIGRWLARQGKDLEAVTHYADAFTIPDRNATDLDRAADRARMGELYRHAKTTETGLGDLMLQAYDRTSALMAKQAEAAHLLDPNTDQTDPMLFTLSGLKGEKLALSSLKGKVIVMDFWATWCGPCRAQHPLYEEVKKRFAGKAEVIFLAVNSDEDQTAVRPFLEANKWTNTVYFEDGLASLLRVSSLPSTLVFDRTGKVFSRMNGYVPDRFVEMLTERINDALGSAGS